MTEQIHAAAVVLFSEILTTEQLLRNRLGRVLPDSMEISHFSVLNHLAVSHAERSPARLARTFNVTRGAMSNTLSRLEASGFVHIRPDWDDARRKLVAISPAGRRARDDAIRAIQPLLQTALGALGDTDVRQVLPVLRAMRQNLSADQG